MSADQKQNLPPSTNGEPELTERRLRFGYWYLTHRERLQRLLIIFLIVFNAVFLGYSLFHIINYAFVGYFADQRLATELVRPLINWPQIHEFRRARSIEILEVHALRNSRGRSNFIALVRNPNGGFYGAFSYRFVGNFGSTPAQRGFVLPGEEKALLTLGVPDLSGLEGAQLELINMAWRRISRHEVPDIANYIQERTVFSVSKTIYTPAVLLGLTQDRLTFDLTNNTIFSFAQVKLNILFYSGGRIIGAEQTAVDSFLSGETRSVDLRLDSLGLGTPEIRVFPEVDIFDQRSFIK